MTSSAQRPYRGVFPVAPTIFDANGNLDLDGQRRCIDFMIDAGSHGICILANFSEQFVLTDAERDTSVPNPPPRAEEEDFNGPESAPQAPQGPQALDSRGGFSDDWIDVFEPQQIAAIRPRANGMVDVVTASDGTAVRLGSRSGDADGAIEITVPADVLRELAGRTSTIALTLQSADDKPVQISVDCDFSRLGACPRHRFTINPQKLDALFRVSFDSGMAPASAGRLVVNADLSGGGRGVNLYSVRILPGQ